MCQCFAWYWACGSVFPWERGLLKMRISHLHLYAMNHRRKIEHSLHASPPSPFPSSHLLSSLLVHHVHINLSTVSEEGFTKVGQKVSRRDRTREVQLSDGEGGVCGYIRE